MEISLVSKLEALLFISGEPVAVTRLSQLLDTNSDALRSACATLQARYAADSHAGLMLLEHAGQVALATKPELSGLIETFTKSTLQETLSKAALEVLSIVAYRGPIARSEIEAIRGVNCSYTLRALLLRGLIERLGHPHDARGYLYQPAFKFLEHLGISRVADLPDYATLSVDERMRVVMSTREDVQSIT